MRIQLWKVNNPGDNEPDYVVKQKQRLNDGTTGYVTVEVGTGIKRQAPDETTYIDITLKGYGNNNKPKP